MPAEPVGDITEITLEHVEPEIVVHWYQEGFDEALCDVDLQELDGGNWITIDTNESVGVGSGQTTFLYPGASTYRAIIRVQGGATFISAQQNL